MLLIVLRILKIISEAVEHAIVKHSVSVNNGQKTIERIPIVAIDENRALTAVLSCHDVVEIVIVVTPLHDRIVNNCALGSDPSLDIFADFSQSIPVDCEVLFFLIG